MEPDEPPLSKRSRFLFFTLLLLLLSDVRFWLELLEFITTEDDEFLKLFNDWFTELDVVELDEILLQLLLLLLLWLLLQVLCDSPACDLL